MIETVERNGRFYTNEKGEIKTENEQLKEWLVIANKENERLKEEYMILQNASDKVEEEKDNEIERLHSIIKEVRECINHYAIEDEDYSKIYNDEEKTILEILDKVEGDNRNE